MDFWKSRHGKSNRTETSRGTFKRWRKSSTPKPENENLNKITTEVLAIVSINLLLYIYYILINRSIVQIRKLVMRLLFMRIM